MAEPLLHRLPSTSRYEKKYRIHGHDHLTVEAYYAEPEDGKPEFGYWWVRDNRFTALDRHRRETVLTATYLSDIRSWLKAGGANLWDPEKRKTDRDWKPIPDGWDPGDERLEAKRRIPFRPFGEKGSIASRAVARDVTFVKRSEKEPEDPPSRDLAGKKYAVVPGWITSVNDGQRHWIGFGALTWLYGVKPSECIQIDNENERGWDDEARAHLIWLHPQRHHRDYESMKEELARGEDAFKLVEP
jgi:hypothetical protein